MSTPAGEVGVGQPRYVVAYTLKQAPEQKQPDILNPDNLQSAKEVIKVKSPTSVDGGDRLMYGGSSAIGSANDFMYPVVTDEPNNIIENAILESSYYMQPPHYSILGNNSSCSSSNNYVGVGGVNEQPHEYSNNYSTVIVTQQEADNSCRSGISDGGGGGGGSGGTSNNYSTYSSQQLHHQPLQMQTLDYRLLSSVKEDDEPICQNGVTTTGSKGSNSKHEYRYSGSDFSMSECISNSNTSTLGNKNRNRNHIITDTLPGPESCV